MHGINSLWSEEISFTSPVARIVYPGAKQGIPSSLWPTEVIQLISDYLLVESPVKREFLITIQADLFGTLFPTILIEYHVKESIAVLFK
jgi:hypothetical protein